LTARGRAATTIEATDQNGGEIEIVILPSYVALETASAGRLVDARVAPHFTCGTVRLAKRLHRTNPVTGQRRSLRKISAGWLAAAGHMMVRKYRGSEVPLPFNPATIKRMIERPMPD
jgi:hypothetical protein